MGRNKMNFIDLCRGEFGRKIAYTGASQITTANVRKVIAEYGKLNDVDENGLKRIYDMMN